MRILCRCKFLYNTNGIFNDFLFAPKRKQKRKKILKEMQDDKVRERKRRKRGKRRKRAREGKTERNNNHNDNRVILTNKRTTFSFILHI